MSDGNGKGEALFPTPSHRQAVVASSHVFLPPPCFDSTSFLFILFICSDLACLHSLSRTSSLQTAAYTVLCVDDQARQYYYEVEYATGSMMDDLEFLHTHLESGCNALAERVSLARTVRLFVGLRFYNPTKY